MKDTATIAADALERARGCTSEQQAIEAGCLFGGELAQAESDPDRQRRLRADLAAVRRKTGQSSYEREFMDAALSVVLVQWALPPS